MVIYVLSVIVFEAFSLRCLYWFGFVCCLLIVVFGCLIVFVDLVIVSCSVIWCFVCGDCLLVLLIVLLFGFDSGCGCFGCLFWFWLLLVWIGGFTVFRLVCYMLWVCDWLPVYSEIVCFSLFRDSDWCCLLLFGCFFWSWCCITLLFGICYLLEVFVLFDVC